MVSPILSRRMLLAFAFTVRSRAESPSGDEREIYREFTRWRLPLGLSGDAGQRYREKLAAEGIASTEIERRLRIVQDLSPGGRGWRMDTFWEVAAESPANKRFRVTPSPWLVQSVKDVKPGKALDLGMGQGRHCLFLAKNGWNVTGVDHSGVAIKHAEFEAAKAHVRYTTVQASVDDWDMGRSQWDLIVSILEPDTRWADRICDSLAPNGLLVREHYGWFHRSENEALKNFGRLRMLKYEDRVDRDHYDVVGSARASQPTRMIRLVAQKLAG